MDSDRSIPEPEVSLDVDRAGRPPAHATTGTTASTSPRRVLLWALAGGLVAGLASWFGGEAAYGIFEPVVTRSPDWDRVSPQERGALAAKQRRINKPAAETKNAALAYGMLGAAVGMTLGLAGGLARSSARAGLLAGLVGAPAGVLGAAVMSALMTPVFFRLLDPDSPPPLAAPLFTHLGIWAAVGVAGGLALGLGLGDRGSIARSAVGGLAGVLLGTFLIEVVIALVFPSMRVYEPIPEERVPRLIVHLGVAVATALGAALALREARTSTASAMNSATS
jgi:hypothetical protein